MYGSPFPPYKKTNHLGIIIMGLKYDKTIILILLVIIMTFISLMYDLCQHLK